MYRIILLILLSVTGLSACSILHRTETSGYAFREYEGPTTVETFYMDRFNKKYKQAAEQLGMNPAVEANEQDVMAIKNRIMLNNMEARISSNSEKKLYYDLKPYFKSDTERIYFLKLPDVNSKLDWAASRNISSIETSFDNTTQNLIDNSDIMKGMSRNAVKQSWGEPDGVEVAGNTLYGNERWIYKKLISTDEGYKHETRYVYFEAGRVAGWETTNTAN